MQIFPLIQVDRGESTSGRFPCVVKKVHDLRIWALTMDKVALSAHLAIDSKMDPQIILQEATRLLSEDYDIFESTVQIETYSEEAMLSCAKCEHPSN